jgi:adenylate kinase
MIIFMGVAGSGKSVQGRWLADEFGHPWLSTGEFLRMLLSGEPRKEMVRGKLLGDREIINLVQKILHMINVNEEFVLDGFPRTAAQADWLLSQVKHGQLHVTAVIHLTASEQAVMERLLSRGRQDDTEEAVRERFGEYEEAALPIIDHFRSAGIPVHDIDGEQPVETVHEAIIKALKADA